MDQLQLDKTKVRLIELSVKWKKEADHYQKQVEEARAKKLPHDQMLSYMVCLRACAKEIDKAL